jgi:hypothetical protein
VVPNDKFIGRHAHKQHENIQESDLEGGTTRKAKDKQQAENRLGPKIIIIEQRYRSRAEGGARRPARKQKKLVLQSKGAAEWLRGKGGTEVR